MALTGETGSIEHVFPDVSSDHYTDNNDIAKIVEQRFGDCYTKDFEYCETLPAHARKWRFILTKELYKVATHLKVPIDQLRLCPDTGYPT
jgi:hypothetical protein